MAVEGGLPLQACALSLPEMPISGDLKSGDSLFFTTPPEFQRTLPPRQTDTAPNGYDLRNYMKSYNMKHILSKFAIIVLLPELIFVSD